MPTVKPGIKIPTSALTWRFSRSSGPGGQHVNTSDSKVELICDLTQIRTSPHIKLRIIEKYGEQLSVVASTQRSQTQNRRLAMEKLMERLEKAAKVPKPRTATKPTKASVRNRLEEKKRNSQRKADRRNPVDE